MLTALRTQCVCMYVLKCDKNTCSGDIVAIPRSYSIRSEKLNGSQNLVQHQLMGICLHQTISSGFFLFVFTSVVVNLENGKACQTER